jgi:hypothetical protein
MWITCPKLHTRISKLEDQGWVIKFQEKLLGNEEYLQIMHDAHDKYSKFRWSLLSAEDILMIESDLGKKVKIGKNYIYLDAPYIYETETEEDILTEGKESKGPNKFAVYTKNKTGGLKKVIFGNSNLIIKESRNCSQKTDRTTVGYWFCNIGKYVKQLGLSSSNS